MNAPVTIPTDAAPVADFLREIEAECERQADSLEAQANQHHKMVRAMLGCDHTIRTLRDIAADCRSAQDGCPASMDSVLDWIAADEDWQNLPLACGSTVLGRVL